MKRQNLLVGALVCGLLLLGPGDAGAKNMHGKFGVGFQRTLLAAQGLSFAYWATPKLCAGLLGGAGFARRGDKESVAIYVAGGAKYVLYATKFANLSVGVLLDVGWLSRWPYSYLTTVGEGEDASTVVEHTSADSILQWGVEIPVEVEYFFSDAFSVNLATGFTFTMTPELGHDPIEDFSLFEAQGLGVVTEPGDKGIGLGVGSLFGHAGFRFYF